MQALRVALVQGATRWHDPRANQEYYAGLVRKVARLSDLAVLPETFLTGFTNDTAGHAEPADGEGLGWMRALAAETGVVITGSLIVRDGDACYNRLYWVQPDGETQSYDKRHLFRMAGEHQHFAGGERQLTVSLKGWRIRPLVCYDLRFPVWSRNRRDEAAEGGMDYDLALYVANWPAARRHAWRTLLRARAIENLSFSLGVNRAGTDGNGHQYAGDSCVIDPLGEALLEFGAEERVETVTLDAARLLEHRQRFPAWMDADSFELR